MRAGAALAAEEYRRRQAAFAEAVNSRGYSRSRADANLRCWLAMALTLGVAPRTLGAVFEHWQAECEYSDEIARIILLDDGPPRAEWSAELARARDAAGVKARARLTDRAAQERSLTLQCLAIALGVLPRATAPAPAEGPQGRPPARSGPTTGRIGREDARAEARAEEIYA